jgi:type II secretory pathway component PulK
MDAKEKCENGRVDGLLTKLGLFLSKTDEEDPVKKLEHELDALRKLVQQLRLGHEQAQAEHAQQRDQLEEEHRRRAWQGATDSAAERRETARQAAFLQIGTGPACRFHFFSD